MWHLAFLSDFAIIIYEAIISFPFLTFQLLESLISVICAALFECLLDPKSVYELFPGMIC